MPDLEFFFDPICPFCWVTSRWVVEVQSQEALAVDWRPLSLALLDEDAPDDERRDASGEYSDSHVRGLEMLRVVHAARDRFGPEVVGDLYTALGELVWDAEPPEGDDLRAVVREMARVRDLRPALRAADLPEELAAASSETDRDDDLRRETREAVARCGGGVGTPILAFSPAGQDGVGTGPALFGPVIDAPPAEEDALRLYEAVETIARWGGFAELKRTVRSFPRTRLSSKVAGTETLLR